MNLLKSERGHARSGIAYNVFTHFVLFLFSWEETCEARHCWSVQVMKKGVCVCVRCFGCMSPRSSSALSLLVLISLAHAADGGRGAFGRRGRRGSRHGPAGRRRRRAGWREIPGRTAAGRTARRERLDHTATAVLKHLLLRETDRVDSWTGLNSHVITFYKHVLL